jgi:putative transposase
MKKRRTVDDVARLLRDVDRDLAKGLTISDVGRKIGVAETTYYRWRQRHNPTPSDTDRRCRERAAEVERLKRLVAELRRDQPRLQDSAPKTWCAPTRSGPRRMTWARTPSSPSDGSAASWDGHARPRDPIGRRVPTNRP